MLCILRIQNFALIDRLELEFQKGLNVLTGETGAGKSIILDAIDIVLGGKANARFIRQGCKKAIVEGSFQTDGTLKEWLKEQEIDELEDGLVVCSRELVITKSSLRSRSRVNGILVNRKIITKLRDRLVEITAQGQTVQLMLPIKQMELLDLYGGEEINKQKQIVIKSFEISQEAKKELDKRRHSEQQRLQRLDLLSYQINELNQAEIQNPEELEQLEQERERLSHIVELQQLSYQIYQLLYQNDTDEKAGADLLADAENLLTDMVNYDKQLEPLLEMVKGALNQIVEAGHQIYAYGEALEASPEKLEEVEERIRQLKQICRKYGPSLSEAIAYYEQLQSELKELTDSSQSIEELEHNYQICQEELTKVCTDLTFLRKEAALKLEKQLIGELKPLAMEKVLFESRLIPCTPTHTGADRVIYHFSPNPGEPLQPLAETASGGEMSRFLLALKACFSNAETGVKTLVFDEIDTGVSGKVAGAIAEKLNQLSKYHQVLCVTHQPLIAAMADTHFRIEKETIKEIAGLDGINPEKNPPEIRTVVRVRALDNFQTRKQELAQLTGGNSANKAIDFAESILETAAKHKVKEIKDERN